MFFAPKPVRRFSLLLLEEGEDYLQEYVCECFLPLNVDITRSRKDAVAGILRLCSKSLFFEPDDIRIPVIRLPFCLVQQLQPQAKKTFEITMLGLTKMKENNQDQPYVHIKRQESRWKFVLPYADFVQFLGLMNEQMQMKSDEDVLLKKSRERVEEFRFNTSRLISFSESISYEAPVTHLMPLVREQGRMVITNERFYFQSMYCVSEGFDLVRSHPLHSIAAVSRRRNALKPCGLEVFFIHPSSNQDHNQNAPLWNGPCAFFAFQSHGEREAALELLFQEIRKYHDTHGNQSIPCGMLECEGEWLNRISLAWQHGKISNFDYLLFLNLASGRTFNDLRQWPVFPWILSNYKDRVLDLNDASNYRDLSKPIGALNPERLATFRQRYHEMPRDPDSPPPFLYGTHYSTPGYVMFWLVRAAPAHMLQLQSGKFDSPDRMFYSINEAWESVSHNPADVKELIPEFFLLNTDFLVNNARIPLGKRQNGKAINDVELPPWAQTALDFLAINRAALESEYVSRNLHLWINLIFGSSQQGQAAVEADNVFYYLSYEGAVDIEQVEDWLERKSLEAQINEFGQTPKQLFKHPHPPRVVIPSTPHPSQLLTIPQQNEANGIKEENENLQPVVGSRQASNQALASALASIAKRLAINSEDEVYPVEGSGRLPPRSPVIVSRVQDQQMLVPSHPVKDGSRMDSIDSVDSGMDIYDKVRKEWAHVDLGPGLKRHQSSSSGSDLRRSVANKVKGINRSINCMVDQFNSKLMLNTKPNVGPSALGSSSPSRWCQSIPHKMQHKYKLSFMQGAVRSVKISRVDGGTLYAAGDNAMLKMYSLERGLQLRSAKIERSTGNGIPLSDLDFLPHPKSNFHPFALVGSLDNCVYVYSIEFGRVIGFFDAHEDAVSVIKYLKGRKRYYDQLLTASWDCSVKIWRLSEGRAPWEGRMSTPPEPEIQFTEHEASVCQAAVSLDHHLLASGTVEGDVSIFDMRSKNPVWRIQPSKNPVTGLCFMPDDEHLICSFEDGTVKLVSMKNHGDVLMTAQCPFGSHSCLSDGFLSLHGMENGKIGVWNVARFLGKASSGRDHEHIPDPNGFFTPLECSTNATVKSLSVQSIASFDGNEALWMVSGQEDGNIDIYSSF